MDPKHGLPNEIHFQITIRSPCFIILKIEPEYEIHHMKNWEKHWFMMRFLRRDKPKQLKIYPFGAVKVPTMSVHLKPTHQIPGVFGYCWEYYQGLGRLANIHEWETDSTQALAFIDLEQKWSTKGAFILLRVPGVSESCDERGGKKAGFACSLKGPSEPTVFPLAVN